MLEFSRKFPIEEEYVRESHSEGNPEICMEFLSNSSLISELHIHRVILQRTQWETIAWWVVRSSTKTLVASWCSMPEFGIRVLSNQRGLEKMFSFSLKPQKYYALEQWEKIKVYQPLGSLNPTLCNVEVRYSYFFFLPKENLYLKEYSFLWRCYMFLSVVYSMQSKIKEKF